MLAFLDKESILELLKKELFKISLIFTEISAILEIKKGDKMKVKISDNDLFVQENFEKLVRKYSRRCIVICRGEIFTGEDALKKARRKYPNHTPMVLPVPAPEEFNHLLFHIL